MAYEKLVYEVLFEEGPYQIRKYEPFVKMETSRGYNQGFSTLFQYISGSNDEDKKIAMTVPVITELNTQKIAFTMPKHMEALGIPNPKDHAISIIKEPERYYISYTFKGNKDIKKTVDALLYYADRKHIEVIGTPKILTYQGPFTPGIFKTYDIIVEVNYDLYA